MLFIFIKESGVKKKYQGVMSSPLKASIVMNPSAVYLHSEIQNSNMIQTDEDLTCNRLDLTQTWQSMNGLDSPTAGYNINTRLGTRQWHGYLYKQSGSHDINKPMRTWHNEQGNQQQRDMRARESRHKRETFKSLFIYFLWSHHHSTSALAFSKS